MEQPPDTPETPPAESQGRFLDGQTAQSWPVEIRLKPDVLLFRAVGDTRVHAWPLSEIHFEFDPRQMPAVIRAYRNGQRLDIGDTKYISILRKTKSASLRRREFWNELDAKDALQWSASAVMLMLAIYFVWPLFADRMAPLVPHRYIVATGDKEMVFLTHHAHNCASQAGQKTLNDIVTRLAGPQTAPDGIVIKMYDGPEINAYAVPPNQIVIMNGLVQHLSSGDQVVAVIAHEIGHIKAGHAARMIMRNLGANLLGQFIGVDQSIMLLSKAHSRDMEREADALGLDMMQKAGISPQNMVELFQSLEKIEGKNNQSSFFNIKLLNYLASHPMTTEREEMARKAAASYSGEQKPVLNDDQWKSLRTMCDAQKLNNDAIKAELGNAGAEATMSAHYLEGKGVSADPSKAFRLATDAANQGNSGGQFMLAFMYLSGHGTAPDEAKAFELMSKSAQQGNAMGQLYLSVMYRYGIGTSVDVMQAQLWAKNAAQQNPPRKESEVTMDIAETEFLLATHYLTGKGVPKDPAHELALVTRAAQMGSAKAQYMLAVQYFSGNGAPKDPAQAFTWALKSAQQDYPRAEKMVALMYDKGIGITVDANEAANWEKKAEAHTDTPTALSPSASPEGGLAPEPPKPVTQAAAVPAPAPVAPTPPQPLTEQKAIEPKMPDILSLPQPASQPLALDQPLPMQTVIAWTAAEVPQVLSLNYRDYTQKLARLEKSFTPTGWVNFNKALQDANFTTALETRKLTTQLKLRDAPQIVQQGVSGGLYAWYLQMPVTLTFMSDPSANPINSILHLKVVRIIDAQGQAGLAIDQWVTASQ